MTLFTKPLGELLTGPTTVLEVIKYAYTNELRPGENNPLDVFIVDEEDVNPNAEEQWAGIPCLKSQKEISETISLEITESFKYVFWVQ